ncbi:MAG: site-specific integrase [Bacteroidia bacterium]|jgi:site-specific recombinase XerD|nr:site-specific integrase [Bacteroidia bacterium]
MPLSKRFFDAPGLYTVATSHRKEDVIFIYFDYNKEVIAELRENFPARWSATNRAWYIPDKDGFRKMLQMPPKPVAQQIAQTIHPANLPAFNKYCEQLTLKGYSANTLRTYSQNFAQLLYTIKQFQVDALTDEQLRSYLLYCHNELKLSESQIHNRINAIKFYFEKVLMQDQLVMELPRPKKPMQLPKVLSVEDVRRMLQVTTNPKHLLILKLTYGMGLRVSEIINLKITDIDSNRMQVLIARAKGKKDRYVNLPLSILKDLRAYYKLYKPKTYLFEGIFGLQYSIRSAQEVFKTALKKAGINKPVGIHALRHSYATHLLENGTDIMVIKNLLGHFDIKTTQVYLHVGKREVGKVRSPLDDLRLDTQ